LLIITGGRREVNNNIINVLFHNVVFDPGNRFIIIGMPSPRFAPWSLYFIAIVGLEAAACLAFLLLIPPDPKNSVLLGYSLNRWLVIGIFVILIGFLAGLGSHLARRPQARTRLQSILLINVTFWPALDGALACIAIWVTAIKDERIALIFSRALPLLVWGLLFFCTLLAFQIVVTGGQIARNAYQNCVDLFSLIKRIILVISRRIYDFLRQPLAASLALVLAAALPALFLNAFRYNLPVGSAGLYTLMSEDLANNHFLLPTSVAYYGPGGMPYAYPPLAFYLMGFFVKVIGVPVIGYLRFAAPLFAWLSLVPAFLLAFELTGSRVAAIVSSLIVASSADIYSVQAEAGGIVRALAFGFALAGLLFYLRATRKPGWRDALLSALFFGLTLLTHLSYALFFALSVAAYVLVSPGQKKRWRAGILAGLAGLVIASPWWLAMLSHYGGQVFAGAFASHGNDYFLSILRDPGQLSPWIDQALNIIRRNPILYGLTLTAFIYFLARKEFFLPLWFTLLLIFASEGTRYLVLVGAIMIGAAISQIYASILQDRHLPGLSNGRVFQGMFFVAACTLLVYQEGFSIISNITPAISAETYTLAAFIQTETPSSATYVISSGPDEAEWFPYLLERTPVIASWGGEWRGTYPDQVSNLLNIMDCDEKQSLPCLEGLFDNIQSHPYLLITHTDRAQLTQQIEESGSWQKIYQNARYFVWVSRAAEALQP
jgi:hypothetical protein